MAAIITKEAPDSVTLQITIPFNRSMIDSENAIQKAIHEGGNLATESLLKRFDTDGSDIRIGSVRMRSKGLQPKYYQTPYGEVRIQRHVYQATATGGATFCPLEREARIIVASTPKFAAQISHKVASMPAGEAAEDLSVNHGRSIPQSFAQRLSEAVSAVVQVKEEEWSYQVPEVQEAAIKTVSIGLDGTCLAICKEGYRQAMVGTIALYNGEGERQHTTYIAASPEYGKETFKVRLAREIERTKNLYPEAFYIGLADGARDNWDFLELHTDQQMLDFYHATEYLTKIADSVFTDPKARSDWLSTRCHQLKHDPGTAQSLLEEFQKFTEKPFDAVEKAITYFQNNLAKSRMNYTENTALGRPIGSGVTEAACKTIVKQRLCQSGMRWKEKGARVILSLRTLVKSSGRWAQFWGKVNQYGFPVAT
jgi:hypothetical protein